MKILIISPSWIGDMMMSQSLYRTIHYRYPNAVIDVMAQDWCLPLLSFMPEVHQSILMPFKHGSLDLYKRFCLGKSLKIYSYDRAYILPNSFKSGLIPLFANIKHRIGWCGEMRYGILNDIRILNKSLFPLMVERYIALGYDKPINSAQQLIRPLLLPQLKVNQNEKNIILEKILFPNKRPLIGFCIGAEFTLKRWPHYHYAKLAIILIKKGYQLILLGSFKERIIADAIVQILSKPYQIYCKNLVGKTSLKQAVMLLANCDGVVSNDSGLMHITAALNRPLVVLYGPSNPDFTPPLSNQSCIIYSDKNDYSKLKYKKNLKQKYHQKLIDIQPSLVDQKLTNLVQSLESSTCMC